MNKLVLQVLAGKGIPNLSSSYLAVAALLPYDDQPILAVWTRCPRNQAALVSNAMNLALQSWLLAGFGDARAVISLPSPAGKGRHNPRWQVRYLAAVEFPNKGLSVLIAVRTIARSFSALRMQPALFPRVGCAAADGARSGTFLCPGRAWERGVLRPGVVSVARNVRG